MGIDNGGERSDSLRAAADPLAGIDVEDRLRRVKRAAARRPQLRRRLARLTGEPRRTDRVLLAAAGSACATTAVLTYLWWRDGRRRPRSRPTRTLSR